jgi:hypothetical protein
MIGTRYDSMPIPPVAGQTHHVPAGRLSIGIEFRHVDPDIIDATYRGVAVRVAGDDTPQRPILNDRGASVHVCDGATGVEYLRFDLFDDDPHYHYIRPGECQLVVPFDRAASGDMVAWLLTRLSTRLPEMLELAGAGDLAAGVERSDVEAALPAVAAAIGSAVTGAARGDGQIA